MKDPANKNFLEVLVKITKRFITDKFKDNKVEKRILVILTSG
jgi:hypothetical protein